MSYSSDKNITLKVVSDELIDKTNGVVQGMSGCPIIQDDKIVGAVTHVLLMTHHADMGYLLRICCRTDWTA